MDFEIFTMVLTQVLNHPRWGVWRIFEWKLYEASIKLVEQILHRLCDLTPTNAPSIGPWLSYQLKVPPWKLVLGDSHFLWKSLVLVFGASFANSPNGFFYKKIPILKIALVFII
jgi:hypothetical protein